MRTLNLMFHVNVASSFAAKKPNPEFLILNDTERQSLLTQFSVSVGIVPGV